MAKDKKGMTDEEFDKIAEDYLMEKFELEFGRGAKDNRKELMKKLNSAIRKIKMAAGGMTTKKTTTKKMRGGGMTGKTKMAKKKMMRGGVAKKK